jgi:ubiquinone/menaquinone biosynthesis C-methylase UbiE
MHERRYSSGIENLRSPERVKILEVERVAGLALAGIKATNMLDVGTGSGIFAEAFSKRGLSVYGIDPNPEMLKAAQNFVPQGTFRQGIVEKIPFEDKAFDIVFLGTVLHESDDLAKALSECGRCARQRVAILEWPYKQEESGPPLEHRLRISDVIEESDEAGFVDAETLQLQHMVLFLLKT